MSEPLQLTDEAWATIEAIRESWRGEDGMRLPCLDSLDSLDAMIYAAGLAAGLERAAVICESKVLADDCVAAIRAAKGQT